MLTAEDIIDDYTNGNHAAVAERLRACSPLEAAIVVLNMYRWTPPGPERGTLVSRIRAWAEEQKSEPRKLVVTDKPGSYEGREDVKAVRPGDPVGGRFDELAFVGFVQITPELIRWLETSVYTKMAPSWSEE